MPPFCTSGPTFGPPRPSALCLLDQTGRPALPRSQGPPLALTLTLGFRLGSSSLALPLSPPQFSQLTLAHHSPTPAPSSSRPALATFLKALPLCPFAPFLKCITCFRKLLQNSFQLQVTYNAILVSAAQQYLDVYRVYKGVPP